MTRLVRLVASLYRLALQEALAIRAGIFIWLLHGLAPLATALAWESVARSPGSGRDPGRVMSYFLAVYLVNQLAASPTENELSREIATGGLSVKLLMPASPMVAYVARKLALLTVGLPVIVGPLFLLVVEPAYRWQLRAHDVPVLLASLAMAVTLHFLQQVLLACLSFWTTHGEGVRAAWASLFFVFGGVYMPMSYLPAWAIPIVERTPFPYFVYVPSAILSGQLQGSDAVRAVAFQLVYTALFFVAARLTWMAGLRTYGAIGR